MTAEVSDELRAVAERIASLPRTLLERDDTPLYTLLEESGYLEHHTAITAQIIRDVLARDSTLVDDWLAYSSDKRTSSGWFCREDVVGVVVGYVGDHETENTKSVYSNRTEACAEFIKHEVEDLRQCG